MIEPKPCPVCKSTRLKIDQRKTEDYRFIDGVRFDRYTASVRCNRCYTRGPLASVFVDNWRRNPRTLTEPKAIERWNKWCSEEAQK